MAENWIKKRVLCCLASVLIGMLSVVHAVAEELRISFHIRGVAETNISLIPLAGSGQLKSILDLKSVKSGQTAEMSIPGEHLPGEFILRFDYKEKPGSTPYPSEKHILVGNQSVELWVHPMYANHPDSTWFEEGELENRTFADFSKENLRRKEKIGLLQQFLMEYDDTDADFYREGIREYEKRRKEYNAWLDKRTKDDKTLFASSLYRFNYLPDIAWGGSERQRLLSMISHYFDGIDFNDPVIIRTAQMNEWMNAYVNLHGQMAFTVALRDSILPAAAMKAIGKAKEGHPQVYGWMVDYFYRGFESNNLPHGMKVLEPYLNDPFCLTTKRMEIERRLSGMKALKPGVPAPDFELKNDEQTPLRLSAYKSAAENLLLLFWSADCNHCSETVQTLYPWSQTPGIKEKLDVIAISLDETTAETEAWKKQIRSMPGWINLRAEAGINSKVANDYFILATPVMILIDNKTGKIAAMPGSSGELIKMVR